MISLIAAVNRNHGIGKGNELLYWLPNDLKRFKALTTGHTIIMGRKTFESLPKGALPHRRNIVLSRQERQWPGTECFHSLEEALQACAHEEEIFIIGGASLYATAFPLADRLYITEVEDSEKEADVFFPAIDPAIWQEKSRECHPTDERHLYSYCFVDYERL
ncbi:MAG: dihydrofolate reductase [Phocaeicola plebeius]